MVNLTQFARLARRAVIALERIAASRAVVEMPPCFGVGPHEFQALVNPPGQPNSQRPRLCGLEVVRPWGERNV